MKKLMHNEAAVVLGAIAPLLGEPDYQAVANSIIGILTKRLTLAKTGFVQVDGAALKKAIGKMSDFRQLQGNSGIMLLDKEPPRRRRRASIKRIKAALKLYPKVLKTRAAVARRVGMSVPGLYNAMKRNGLK